MKFHRSQSREGSSRDKQRTPTQDHQKEESAKKEEERESLTFEDVTPSGTPLAISIPSQTRRHASSSQPLGRTGGVGGGGSALATGNIARSIMLGRRRDLLDVKGGVGVGWDRGEERYGSPSHDIDMVGFSVSGVQAGVQKSGFVDEKPGVSL